MKRQFEIYSYECKCLYVQIMYDLCKYFMVFVQSEIYDATRPEQEIKDFIYHFKNSILTNDQSN